MPFRIPESLRQAFSPNAEAVHIQGTFPVVQAYLISCFIYENFHLGKPFSPLVVICPTEESVSDYCQDLLTFCEMGKETLPGSKIGDVTVLSFPTWEHSPYSSISPSLRTRFSRLSALNALTVHDSKNPCMIVTTFIAACQTTLPRATFLHQSLKLALNQSLGSREKFTAALLERGYLRTDTVEDIGTFSVRGEIIDLFPADRQKPLRIELFDDQVERIREFDPTSQRTSALPLDSVTLPPAREVLVNQNTQSFLREQIKHHADHYGIPKGARDPLLEAIREGYSPEHCDAWAPFAYDRCGTLWDYLPPSSRLIWNDASTCFENFELFSQQQKKLFEQSIQKERVIPSPETLFLWGSHQKEQVSKYPSLYFDRLEITSLLPSANEAPPTKDRVTAERFPTPSKEALKHPEALSVIFAPTQGQMSRIQFLLENKTLTEKATEEIKVRKGGLSEGFRWSDEKILFLPAHEILGNKRVIKKHPSQQSAAQGWSELQALSDLAVGDTVVHIEHGVGRYEGISRLSLSGAMSDYLLLEYANKDKLYLPVYRLNLIQKYIGAGESVSLDRLGTSHFQKTKEKVKESAKKLAFDLVQLYAARKIHPGVAFSPRDAALTEFESQFPYEETPDQLKAIDAVLADLESGQVMDRLVCGDVGYGKTEVALRGAFRAVMDGKQVAVLVPTTLLAQQHEQSFKTRLSDHPILVESLSRFKTAREQKKILEALAQGKIDIIIGTHRLLSKDVQFQDLGLIIVDEEHRFGVEHKERLKTMKVNTHVLTLTATPIPRTLSMALSGLREISIINTPPVDRLPIRTFISCYDEDLIQKAIETELSRGGQVFFLHNRVQTIEKMAETLRKLVPSAHILVAHGQMSEKELEDTMIAFSQKKAQVLVCTTIIESGIDLPSANTILINRADTLGLAQLYQIRGRVGRADQRAYAYLLIPKEGFMTDEAKQRLEVIQRFVELGSGFSIASHDLEIRGGGDLLGPQQSGSIAAVGLDLYTELLDEAIREIQGKPVPLESATREPEIKVPFPAYLSEESIPDIHHRLSLYRRISAAKGEDAIEALESELQDRFGALPQEAQNLLWIVRIKLLLKEWGIEGLTVGPARISLISGLVSGPASEKENKLDPIKTLALAAAHPELYQLTPDSKLILKMSIQSLPELWALLDRLFKSLADSRSLKSKDPSPDVPLSPPQVLLKRH